MAAVQFISSWSGTQDLPQPFSGETSQALIEGFAAAPIPAEMNGEFCPNLHPPPQHFGFPEATRRC